MDFSTFLVRPASVLLCVGLSFFFFVIICISVFLLRSVFELLYEGHSIVFLNAFPLISSDPCLYYSTKDSRILLSPFPLSLSDPCWYFSTRDLQKFLYVFQLSSSGHEKNMMSQFLVTYQQSIKRNKIVLFSFSSTQILSYPPTKEVTV